jgi:hypothetical protein
MRKTIYFHELPIGAKFHCNGNSCIKKSTRTAWISPTLWFYFGMREGVSIEV